MFREKMMFPAFAVLLILLTSCSHFGGARKVSLESNLDARRVPSDDAGQPPLQFAIATMVSPEETITLYKKIMDYVARKLGREYVLVQKDTYGQVNDLFSNGAIDMAFVCSGAYVELTEKTDAEILAVPVVNGKTVYYSYIIVPAHSNVKHIGGLKGKSFAFVDPLSNTGYFYPVFLLSDAKMGGREKFFKNSLFTNSHSASVMLVADGNVDGAAVDSLILDFMYKKAPSLRERVRIIKKSPSYAIPPFIVHAGMDSGLKEKIRGILFRMNKNPEGAGILADLNIERFSRKADSDYDSVRNLYNSIQGRAVVK